MANMHVTLFGSALKNPVILASGTAGYGKEIAGFYPLRDVGALTLKAVSLKKRAGNPPPRIAETASGAINSIGLANEGIDYFETVIVPSLNDCEAVYIANVVGDSIEEYAEVCARLERHSVIRALEINVSCPNVRANGEVFGQNIETLTRLICACKARATKPIIVKLPPYTFNVERYIIAAQNAGADALSLINTVPSFDIDVATGAPVVGNTFGGLSGPAILPIALRHVYLARNAATIPIIGGGGITTGADAYKFLLAGANAVSVGLANMIDPNAGKRIAAELNALLDEKGVSNVTDIIGSVRRYDR